MISRDFPLSNYNRTVLRVRVHVRVRTCRAHASAKLFAVFVLPSAPTRSCQSRDEKSTSQVRGGIRLPSLQRRRDRDGQLALGLPAGKAAYEAGIQVPASAEVQLFSFLTRKGCQFSQGVHNILQYIERGCQISWDAKYPVTPKRAT